MTYEGVEAQYIGCQFILLIDYQHVNNIIQYESGGVAIEFDDTSCNDYAADELVSVFFYRLEAL